MKILYKNMNTEKTHKIENGDTCMYYVNDTQKDQVCSHVWTTGEQGYLNLSQ